MKRKHGKGFQTTADGRMIIPDGEDEETQEPGAKRKTKPGIDFITLVTVELRKSAQERDLMQIWWLLISIH